MFENYFEHFYAHLKFFFLKFCISEEKFWEKNKIIPLNADQYKKDESGDDSSDSKESEFLTEESESSESDFVFSTSEDEAPV